MLPMRVFHRAGHQLLPHKKAAYKAKTKPCLYALQGDVRVGVQGVVREEADALDVPDVPDAPTAALVDVRGALTVAVAVGSGAPTAAAVVGFVAPTALVTAQADPMDATVVTRAA